jgi:hypothetical protein
MMEKTVISLHLQCSGGIPDASTTSKMMKKTIISLCVQRSGSIPGTSNTAKIVKKTIISLHVQCSRDIPGTSNTSERMKNTMKSLCFQCSRGIPGTSNTHEMMKKTIISLQFPQAAEEVEHIAQVARRRVLATEGQSCLNGHRPAIAQVGAQPTLQFSSTYFNVPEIFQVPPIHPRW